MCEKSGFKFIGPASGTIESMGDKITAKTLAEDAGIQIVPGYKEDIPKNEEEFKLNPIILDSPECANK